MSYTPLVNPIFTGNVRVPTAAPGSDTTIAASTAFVTDAIDTAVSAIDTGNFVTLDSTQTITGAKTFDSANLTVTGADFLALDNGKFRVSSGASSSTAFDALVTGDGNVRYRVLADGTVSWGDGAGTPDASLTRTAAAQLTTESEFITTDRFVAGIDGVTGFSSLAADGINMGDGLSTTPGIYILAIGDDNDVFKVQPSSSDAFYSIRVTSSGTTYLNDDTSTIQLYQDGNRYHVQADGGIYTNGVIEMLAATAPEHAATLGQVQDEIAGIDYSGLVTTDTVQTITAEKTIENARIAFHGITPGQDFNLLGAYAQGDAQERFYLTTNAIGWTDGVSASLELFPDIANNILYVVGNGSHKLGVPNLQIIAGSDPVFEARDTGNLVWFNGLAEAATIAPDGDDIKLLSGSQLLLEDVPTNDLSAVNKVYVDGVAQGLDIKASARVATTGNITLSGAQTIDGVSAIAGDRVLVKDQTAGEDNGIYEVAAGAWSRAADLDEPSELNSGIFIFIEEGSVNGDTGWVVTTNNPIVLGTDPVTWTQFAGAGSVSAGNGLTKTGNVLDVGAGTGIVSNANDVAIDPTYVMTLGTAQTASGAKTFTSELTLDDAALAGTYSDTNNAFLYTIIDGEDWQRFFLGATGNMVWGDGATPTDTSLERSAAGQLSMFGEIGLYVDRNLALGDGTNDSSVTIRNDSATNVAWDSRVGSDSVPRFATLAGGKLEWGTGAATADTNLYRNAANQLKTDDAFYVGDQLDVAGAANILGVGGKTTLTIASGVNQGITIGDVNIYRAAANELKTDDALTIVGKLTHDAGLNVKTTTKTANYTVDLATDYVVMCDSTGGTFTITLPATHAEGDTVVVKDVGGLAETNAIVIDPADADTIDGQATFTLTVNFQAATFISNGTNWFLI